MPPETQVGDEAGYSWGKMGPGRRFLMTAEDLDRAWAAARTAHLERRFLQYLREKGWGESARRKSDPAPVRVSLSKLADLWQVARPKLSRDVNALVRDRMVIRAPEGYSIAKDASAWGGDRLRPCDIHYAITGEGRPRPRSGDETSVPGVGTGAPETVPEVGTPPVPEVGTPPVPGVGTKSSPEWGHPDAASYRNAGANPDREIKKTINPDCGGQASPRGPVMEPTPAGPLPPNPAATPPEETPEALDAKLAGWVRALVLAKTADPAEADRFVAAAGYWRSIEIPHHHIASILAEFFAVKAMRPGIKDRLDYAVTLFKARKPGQDIPPCPAEWKPRPATPPVVVRTPEMKARAREAHLQRIRDIAERGRRARESMGVAS